MKKFILPIIIILLISTSLFCSALSGNPTGAMATSVAATLDAEGTQATGPEVLSTEAPTTEADTSLGKITFISGGDIYVMNPDGSGKINITNTPGIFEMNPKWSYDGQRIAFATLHDGNIFVMDADGGNIVQLTSGQSTDESPAWYPDGNRIIFTSNRSGKPGIYFMDTDGENVTLIFEAEQENQILMDPTFSPDGRQIAFCYKGDLHIMDLESGTVAAITHDGELNVSPAWSPDGTRIAYHSQREFGNAEIYVINSDGSNDKRITFEPDFDQQPSWSANGLRILFASVRDGNLNLYTMNPDGSDVVQLTFDYAAEPHWQQGFSNITVEAPSLFMPHEQPTTLEWELTDQFNLGEDTQSHQWSSVGKGSISNVYQCEQGGLNWRNGGGSFSVTLAVTPGQPFKLIWQSNDAGSVTGHEMIFDVLADDQLIQSYDASFKYGKCTEYEIIVTDIGSLTDDGWVVIHFQDTDTGPHPDIVDFIGSRLAIYSAK